LLPVAFLQTGQSAKSRFCELEGYKAAIGDLTHPTQKSTWQKFPDDNKGLQADNQKEMTLNF